MQQSKQKPSAPAPAPPARSRLRLVLALVALIVLAIPAGRWYLAQRGLAVQVDRGLRLLDQAKSSEQVAAALVQWDRQTRTHWEDRADALVAHLFRRYELTDWRVRALLARVTGVDFGPRVEDWERWYRDQRRHASGQPPVVPQRERVALTERWTAPVGLTAWFSTILPLDGTLYVASLGGSFGSTDDPADGVVRVNGLTGEADLWFRPPANHRGPTDVIGLSAWPGGLFVACYNGSVYCLDRAGNVRWHAHAGAPIIAPPVTVDTNDDGTWDVVVATDGGNVVAISGHRGNTTWVRQVADVLTGTELLGATLAQGALLPGAGRQLLVTYPTGAAAVLTLREGRILWRGQPASTIIGGGVFVQAETHPGAPAYILTGNADLLALAPAADSVTAVRAANLAWHAGDTTIAAPRALEPGPDRPALTLAALAGDPGAVCAFAPEGLHWRVTVPGPIWATPPIADLNGNHRPELVLATMTSAMQRQPPCLQVLSIRGHLLYEARLDHPVECPPIIADIDGDSLLEIVVADRSGWLRALATADCGAVYWGLAGGDSFNTRNAASAYAWGQVPCGFQWDWAGE
jgi:hypothetical protein